MNTDYRKGLNESLNALIAEQEERVKVLADKNPRGYTRFLEEVPEQIVSMVMDITYLPYPMALAITAAVWLDTNARKGMELENHPKSEFGYHTKWYAETDPLVITATKIALLM